ncbi:RluA family pseudouridine synthase [Hydromonas duriensis]|uniref:Pseudouridine synthase n=1 Tax=Hydromonas duriensis TaxID=1527608 RepID=A0A4V3DK40_9BURK|nr:RluA family pseudouridine synthase [Hydromonas duriensis]TDR32593.1 ribosomal large subunit pseudouridine synthase C [Hydromonas duriensis]
MKHLRKTFEQKNVSSLQIAEKNTTPAPVSVRLHTVGEEEAGQRIDNFLLRICRGVPKSWVYRVVRKGEVRVNKGRVDVEYKLQVGDVVRIPPVRVAERTSKPVPTARATKLPVVYEDDALLVIDKPAGLAVHGGSGVSFGVIEQLRAAYPDFKFIELVHRLDKETSGLLMLAKKRSVLVALHETIRLGQMDKRYYAILKGEVTDKENHVRVPLYKFVAANGDRRVLVSETGQSAHSRFNIDKVLNGYTAVRVKIYTGRTHQIRVHSAHLGHPIVGDDKYGDFDLNKALAKQKFDRMFLHAHELRLKHPVTGEMLALTAELPIDFVQFINKHSV